MARNISLADLRAEADKSYGDLIVDGVVFRALLRLADKSRKKASELLDRINGLRQAADEDAGETLTTLSTTIRELLILVGADQAASKALVAQLDDAELMTLLAMWNETTQPGEAASSES